MKSRLKHTVMLAVLGLAVAGAQVTTPTTPSAKRGEKEFSETPAQLFIENLPPSTNLSANGKILTETGVVATAIRMTATVPRGPVQRNPSSGNRRHVS